MAHLYPGNIGFCKSNAEKKLYNIFKNFSDDFHIIHSLNWLSLVVAKELNRYSPDGEIDFIIIHKKYGILCLEIKGGRITYNRHAFFTNGKQIKRNPYDQAKDNMYAILRSIDEFKNITIGYAVGFPDNYDSPNNYDYADITFNFSHIDKLETKIIEIFNYWNKSINKKIYFDDNTLQQILNNLLPTSIDSVNHKIIYDNRTWLTLSEQQTDIIREALDSNKYFISGRAGTGKTILAIILARLLVEKQKYKILFLSFNKEITTKIKKDLQNIEDNVDVLTFHHFLKKNNPLNNIQSVIKNENRVLEAITESIPNSYDCLIIDEAQSLAPIWLNHIRKYFDNKKIYIFADELQSFGYEGKIKDSQMNKIFNFNRQKILTTNYRSPYKVYKRLLEMFTPSIEQTTPRNIDELDLIEHISDTNIQQSIENTINKLLSQSVDKNDIIIIVSSFANTTLKQYTYKDIPTFTVQSYRGMEKPIIIYVVTSAKKSDLNEFYVAYSRATTQTIVIIPNHILSKGRTYLEQLLLNSEITDDNLKDKINSEIEEFCDLLVSNHQVINLLNIKIYYSNTYLLFLNFEYSFINSLLIEYFINNNICSIAVNKNDLNTAQLYSNKFKEMKLNHLEFSYCEYCKTTTYKTDNLQHERFCVNCFREHFTCININEIKALFNIFSNLHSNASIEQMNLMDESLKILGRFYYHNYHNTLTDEVIKLLNKHQFDKVSINGILKLLFVLEKHHSDIITIEEIHASKYIQKLNCNETLWKRELGININRFIQQGFIEKLKKLNKKIYKINKNSIFNNF